jgi:hypothetical protein
MTAPPVTVVLDPADDIATHRHIADIGTEPGTLVIELRPGARRLQQIAEDALYALGKDLTRRGADRNTQESWTQATAWIMGERINRLIVTRCHTMTAGYIDRLLELAVLTGSQVTLVYGAGAHNRRTA